MLTCTQCGTVAWLDVSVSNPDQWHIRYRRVNRDSSYYYVAVHFGRGDWLSAQQALEISTNGYAQRQRVIQVQASNLTWLHPSPLRPPPPLMKPDEKVYLSLKGVTLQDAPPPGFWVRADQGDVQDSGKFYVTDQRLHLLGQRRDWSHGLDKIARVGYDRQSWTIVLQTSDQVQQYRGLNAQDQLDAQLVAMIVEALWLSK
ncbi:MAG: hypothetical protein JXQ72_14400 [Anaerolineae bacterium]|nr:hypothetical protein [Anaerolineae bacterium]